MIEKRKSSYDIVRIVWQLGNILVKNRNKKLNVLKLTSVQTEIVAFLLRNTNKEEINQLDIQEYLLLSNPAVTGILKRMEEKGLIERARSCKDSRNKNIELTKKGLDLKEVLKANMAEEETRIIKGMTSEERMEFVRLLHIALKNIDY